MEDDQPQGGVWSSLSCGIFDSLCVTENEETDESKVVKDKFVTRDIAKENVDGGEKLGKIRERRAVSEIENEPDLKEPDVALPPMTPTEMSLTAARDDGEFAAFKAVLRGGMEVKKHSTDGKSRARSVYSDAECTSVGWRKLDGRAAKMKKRYLFRDVLEVRLASEIDPSSRTAGGNLLAGTETLRKCIVGTMAHKAFSIIVDDRTLDFEVADEAACQMAVKCFKRIVQEAKSA